MTALTSLLSKLPALKSSEDFAGAVATLETAHSEASAKVAELEAGREDRIFSGGDLAKLASDISAAEGNAKTLAVALAGAQKRHGQATEAEAQAELEVVGKAARKAQGRLRVEMADFEKGATALACNAENIAALRSDLAALDAKLRAGNRADLIPVNLLSEEAKATGRLAVDPLANLAIPGHWPHTRPKTLKLAG